MDFLVSTIFEYVSQDKLAFYIFKIGNYGLTENILRLAVITHFLDLAYGALALRNSIQRQAA